MIKKTLCFYFYTTRETLHDEINKIHFECLKHYKMAFNEVIIGISVDDLEDIELISKTQECFMEIFGGLNITSTFKTVLNNPILKESLFFHNEIVLKMNNYDSVLFGHNQCLLDLHGEDIETLKSWICAMYYLNLYNIPEVMEFLYKNSCSFTYGPCLITDMSRPEKPRSYYYGGFYWLNTKRILHYWNYNKFPEIYSSEYAKDFINILGGDETRFGITKKSYYWYSNIENNQYNCESFLKQILIEETFNDFNNFKKNILYNI